MYVYLVQASANFTDTCTESPIVVDKVYIDGEGGGSLNAPKLAQRKRFFIFFFYIFFIFFFYLIHIHNFHVRH